MTSRCSSSCSKAGYLAKGMLSFAITKHSSNFHPIRVRDSRSIVNKLHVQQIVEASTADVPLALTLSAQSRTMAALWTSTSVVQQVAHLLIRRTSYSNLRKILQRLETSFVLLTYGTVERCHVALVSLKFATKP